MSGLSCVPVRKSGLSLARDIRFAVDPRLLAAAGVRDMWEFAEAVPGRSKFLLMNVLKFKNVLPFPFPCDRSPHL